MPSNGRGHSVRHLRTFASLLVAVLLLGTLVAVAGSASQPKFTASSLTPDSTFVGAKSASGALAETDPALLGRTDSTPVSVLIKYDYDATASYAGGVAGLAATSPTVTGKKLNENLAAVRAYERRTDQVSSEISAAVTKAVPDTEIRESFQMVYGGVAAQVPANKVADLLEVAGVVAVQKDSLAQLQTSVTPDFIGATDVWPSLGGQDDAASNIVVGVLDSGIWPEHPSFEDHGLPAPPGGPYGCQFGDGKDVANLGPTFVCNRKLVGAYAFTNTYMAEIGAGPDQFCNDKTQVCSARDSVGHGTHTASTAAGDRVDSAVLYGAERGPVSGMAPGARVIAYRVCLADGCFGSDSVAGIEQAILDDVDVINYSAEGGSEPYTDAVELAFLDAFHAGISVVAAAGNGGPDAGTVDHGGPWVTTVGASTSDRFFASTLHLTADDGATLDKTGYTITQGISSATPVILAESIPGEDARCLTKLTTAAQVAAATGKIVACQRGGNQRPDKGFNVVSGGAAGMILYNQIAQDVETDNHWLPTIHVDGPSAPLLAFINEHKNVKATWVQGVATPTQGDVMALFSSRGPQGDFIKPDLTAPGVQVLAGMTPDPDETTPANGPPGKLYQAIAGTSMSSPHAAGASALVKAAHPSWTPAMIKSALMTSSAQDVVKEDGVTPADPFDDGAGSLRVDRAINPTLVFDESFDDFFASIGDPLHRIDLNLASVDAPTMTGTITTRRTAINVSGAEQELEVSVDAPDGASILVSDSAPASRGRESERGNSRRNGLNNGRDHGDDHDDDHGNDHGNGHDGDGTIHLKKYGKTDIWITISGPELADGQYFGRITLSPKKSRYNDVTIPVAFNKRQGDVTLTYDCTPTTFKKKTESAHCMARVANVGSVAADVGLKVTNLDKQRGLEFKNISAPATSIKRDDGVQWSGSLTPAVAPQIVSITPGGSPGGYVPLSVIGVPPIAGVGDETITNFTVPTFMYGGEPYTTLGVVSNGYLVLGGGTAIDIASEPQTFPDPNRPNNVVAPFWSDLNPAAGGAIRIGGLTDGVSTWIVVDWAGVPNFGNATTHSFEVWIKTGNTAASEEVTMAYGVVGAGDPDSGVNYGAENRDGTSGKNITPAPKDGSDYTINTSPPADGGTATIEFDASSKKKGTYKSVAAMTSNVTPGTTQVVVTLTVTG